MKTLLTFLLSAAALTCVPAAVPVINSANNATFTVGFPGSFTFTATNPPLTSGSWHLSAGTLPTSLSLDPVSGKLIGTPQMADIGTYPISITVANGSGTSVAQSFTVAVQGAIVIVKYNTAATWTRNQVDDLRSARPYAHKSVSGSESWSRYEIVNLTTGIFRVVSYDTSYDRGVAIKRYDIDPTDHAVAGSPYAFSAYYRAGGTNAAPTYQWQDQFSGSSSDGGPDDVNFPSTVLSRYESMYFVTAGPLALTTIIPATASPVIAPVKALVPIGATGVDNSYSFFANYASVSPGTPPDSITVEFSSGAPTVNYDSVLSASANKAVPAAASLIDYDGTVLSPLSTEYAIKLVRDSLELLGYEKR